MSLEYTPIDSEKACVAVGLICGGPEQFIGADARKIMGEMFAILDYEDFADARAAMYWRAIQEMHAENTTPIDAVTLAQKTGLPELEAIGELLNWAREVPIAANGAWYARNVAEKAKLRTIALGATEAAATAVKGQIPSADVLDGLRSFTAAMLKDTQLASIRTAGDVAREVGERIDARVQGGAAALGISTGLKDFDARTGGLRPTELVILAARTSMGKSALAGQIAARAAMAGHPVLFLSLEMASTAIMERIIANVGMLDHHALKTNPKWLDMTSVNRALSDIGKTPLHMVDVARKLSEVQACALRWRAANPDGDGLIVVDYLQLVTTSKRNGESREQQVAEVSRALKAIAVDTQSAVLALAQLNRKVETEGRDPGLADLRESGAIEQDADVVLFVQRNRAEKSGQASISVAKNRDGSLGKFLCHWDGPHLRFDAQDWADEAREVQTTSDPRFRDDD